MRMLNRMKSRSGTDTTPQIDLCPPHLQSMIDEINGWVYTDVNNGVYKCGFSTTQQAYDKASAELHQSLDRLEKILSSNRFLLGDRHATQKKNDCVPHTQQQ
jgi:glutathionyl-hydroquinone reductase